MIIINDFHLPDEENYLFKTSLKVINLFKYFN